MMKKLRGGPGTLATGGKPCGTKITSGGASTVRLGSSKGKLPMTGRKR